MTIIETTESTPSPWNMQEILAHVAARHNFTSQEVRGDVVNKKLTAARHEAMWTMRQVTWPDGKARYSYPQIGTFFKRDHTTVMSACKRHAERTKQK